MKNLELYDKVREVPAEAKKNIGGGRLKGMTNEEMQETFTIINL